MFVSRAWIIRSLTVRVMLPYHEDTPGVARRLPSLARSGTLRVNGFLRRNIMAENKQAVVDGRAERATMQSKIRVVNHWFNSIRKCAF